MDFIFYMLYNTIQYIKSNIYRHAHTAYFYIYKK